MKKALTQLLVCTALIAFSFTFSSCNKIKSQISIPDIFLKSKDIVFDIPATAAGSQIQSADISFDINSEIAANNTSGVTLTADNIKSAKVSKAYLDITSGANTTNNFANFIAGGVGVYSNVAPTHVTVAQIDNNPDVYTTHLDLPLTGSTDISSLLKGSVITYIYGYTLRRATTVPLHVILHVEYDIQLSL